MLCVCAFKKNLLESLDVFDRLVDHLALAVVDLALDHVGVRILLEEQIGQMHADVRQRWQRGLVCCVTEPRVSQNRMQR